MEKKRVCDTCKWLSDPYVSVCCNGNSEHRADFMSGDDTCEHWEAMEDAHDMADH